MELGSDAKPGFLHHDRNPKLPERQAPGKAALLFEDFFDDEGNRFRAHGVFLEEHQAAEQHENNPDKDQKIPLLHPLACKGQQKISKQQNCSDQGRNTPDQSDIDQQHGKIQHRLPEPSVKLPVHKREKSAHHQRPPGLVFKAEEEFFSPVFSLPDIELREEIEDDVQDRQDQIDRGNRGEKVSFPSVGAAEKEGGQQRDQGIEEGIRPSGQAARLRVHQRCEKVSEVNRDIGQQHSGIRLFFCPIHTDQLQHRKQIDQRQYGIVCVDHQCLHPVGEIQKVRAAQRGLSHDIGPRECDREQNLQHRRVFYFILSFQHHNDLLR